MAEATLQVSDIVEAGVYSVTITLGNDDGQSASCALAVMVTGPPMPIVEIQGRTTDLSTLTSPLEGELVATAGVVTVVLGNGFFLQDPVGDGDADTPAKPDDDHVFAGQVQFPDSRGPLVGEFEIKKRPFIVIGNHWNSKGGDGALYGATQPPVRNSEEQRQLQATYLHDYLDKTVFAADPKASVVVTGDLNDFPFPEPGEGLDPLMILKGNGSTSLTNLIERMPARQRYTFIFERNSQVLDHLLGSKALLDAVEDIDVAAFNASYGSLYEEDISTAASSSDHNPPVVWLTQSKIKKK